MGVKLSSKQQVRLAFLDTLPPKFERFKGVIEQMASLQADEAQVRGLARQLDEIKAQAQGLGLNNLADCAGIMGTLARRTGGHQVKVRGLREQLVSLRVNFDGAYKAASTPERDAAGDD